MVDLCVYDLLVRLIVNGGGLVYVLFGFIYEVIEDIVIMCVLFNMIVVVFVDVEEMKCFMVVLIDWLYLIYIWFVKGGDWVVIRLEYVFMIGKVYLLCEVEGGKVEFVLLIGIGVVII